MSCPKCGATLVKGAPACPVCDPWGSPAGAVAAPVGLAAIPLRVKIPRWIERVADRNPPAYADLEKAWRNSVIAGGLATVFGVFAEAALVAANLVHSSGLCEVCVAVAALALLGLLGLAIVVRRNFWLSRAVAVVGTRPDIGYQGFARLQGIAWITRMLRALPVLIISFGAVNIVLIGSDNLSAANAVYDVYLLLLAVNCTAQYVFQASARQELARLLAR
jgi:hypothetical protein